MAFASIARVNSVQVFRPVHVQPGDRVWTPACGEFAKFYNEFLAAGLGGSFCNNVGAQGGWHTAFTGSGVIYTNVTDVGNVGKDRLV